MKRSIKFKVQVKQNSSVDGLRVVSLDVAAQEQQMAFISQLSELGVYPSLPTYLKRLLLKGLLDYEKNARDFLVRAASLPNSKTEH